MALNNNKELSKKRVKQILLFGFLFFLFVFNVVTFCQYASSNSQELINYKRPIDEFRYFRNPLIGMGFLNNKGEVKVLVLPDDIINHLYVKKNSLMPCDKAIVIVNAKTSNKHIRFIKKYVKNIVKGNFSDIAMLDAKGSTFVWFDDINHPLPDFEKIRQIVKEKGFKPKAFDLSDYKQLKNIVERLEVPEEISLDEQYENLKNFVQDYKSELRDYVENYHKKDFNINHFNDKAAVLIKGCDKENVCEYFGDFGFTKSLTNVLKYNLQIADEKFFDAEKKIFLLTKIQKQNFLSEKEFLQKLDNDTGVILQKGYRMGFLTPDDWQKYKTKEDFVTNLKIKAGFSPDYWNENIEIFYFKAVEI